MTVQNSKLNLNRYIEKIRWTEVIACSLMLCIGSVVFGLQLVSWAIPQADVYQNYVPTHGTVQDTRINEEQLYGKTVYRPEVSVLYRTQEGTFQGWTFDYGRTAFDSKNTAQQALLPFERNKSIPCWYRFGYPEQVIAVWDISIWGWVLLVFSLLLVFVGCTGFWQSFRYLALSKERQNVIQKQSLDTRWVTVPTINIVNDSPGTRLSYRLPLGNRPLLPLAGLTVFAAVWNLIAAGILIHLFMIPVQNELDQVFGIVLRALFCTIGVFLLLSAIRQLWVFIRVSPTLLELSDHPLHPGRKYRGLLFQNGIFHFQKLSVDLVCEEIARFHQGTDTATNRKDVFRQTLFALNDFSTSPEEPLDKEFYLQIPYGAMHSFRQPNNEVLWKLELTTQLTGWHKVCRDCPLVVRPADVME